MFTTLKVRWQDMRTIARLCTAAENIARAEPGSEHLVLASLELPDGSSREVFARLGLSREAFAEAIQAQFTDALGSVGLNVPPSEPEVANSAKARGMLYRAAPSGQALIQRLVHMPRRQARQPLAGADILLAVAEEQFSIAARAFARLGIRREQLAAAATQALEGQPA
ncbi:Clp protease N-terminal domain-containing protein [Piscinibacter sp. HJYY11]|uniref:Clp protease N-terminal domain-containing protein n=1 Tax=Piscinibacter sp. HJYY11 TaxID=2801333 RepID=UPI00191D60D2|nr:Clp protease N-terminal domain-containing protein [Piscinibacter sp. HJYY11]MBL0728252.1 Clp protease N-terminal domain-containing protein [Piscinibacter sp. HJYY11]